MPDDTTAPAAPAPHKPGWKTSELWLTLAAAGLTALFQSGALTNNSALAIASIAAVALTSAGYTVSRTLVKRS